MLASRLILRSGEVLKRKQHLDNIQFCLLFLDNQLGYITKFKIVLYVVLRVSVTSHKLLKWRRFMYIGDYYNIEAFPYAIYVVYNCDGIYYLMRLNIISKNMCVSVP